MDQWVAMIENYPTEENLHKFYKAVQNAKDVLKEDLANFEIEWVLQSILSDPVNVTSVLVKHKNDDTWSQATADALDLVSSIVTAHSQYIDSYVEDIIKMCVQPYQPYVRRRAVRCLTAMAASEHSQHLDLHVSALRNSLRRTDEPLSLRVPLAQLFGAMCEFCPETMRGYEVELWRTYLSILEANNTADSLVKGVVMGVTGLLKNYGRELSTLELNLFYDKLTSKYIHIESCEEAALQFLEAHASLYPEKLSKDSDLRRHLWRALECGGRAAADAAVLAVYAALASASAALDDVIKQELYPKMEGKSKVKNVAFQIVSNYTRLYRNKISDDLAVRFEKQISHLTARLEFDMERKLTDVSDDARAAGFDYELVELMGQASWCVAQDVVGAEGLLYYLLRLYPYCPPASRRKLVLHPLLAASDRLRAAAVAFLLSESCNDHFRPLAADGHVQIWRDVFNSQNGKDAMVLRHSRPVFDEFLNSLIVALTVFAEKRRGYNSQITHEKLASLLHQSHQILSLEHVEEWLAESAPELLALALRVRTETGLTDALILFVAVLADKCDKLSLFEEGAIDYEVCQDLKTFFMDLRVERCSEESRLCASCAALLQAPLCMLSTTGDLLIALQVIFSRSDAEPELLCKALQKFENYLNNKGEDEEYELETIAVIKQIKRARDSSQCTGKEARLFRRNVLRFLGKYGSRCGTDNDVSNDIFEVKSKLVFKLPNKMEGVVYEVSVQELCAVALTHEHAPALRMLLLLLCANYDEMKESGAATAAAESAVALVHALCRCHGRGDDCGPLPHLQHALHLAPDKIACVHRLMRNISEETSPGVRKMLADLLESLLCADPLFEDTRAALVAALDKCNVMMATHHPVTRRAGLDLSVSVVVGLKENMELFKENVSELMMNVLRTNERDFETSYDVILQAFRDMFVLCSEPVLDELLKQIVDNLINIDYCASVYENIVRRSLDTVKLIYDHRRLDSKDFLLILSQFTESLANRYENENFPCKWLHLLMVLKNFDFDAAAWKTIIVHEDFFTLKCCMRLVERKNDLDAFTLVFRVLGAYADVLIELQRQELLDLLTKIIKYSTPKFLNKIYTRMEDCFDKYRKLWGSEWPLSMSSSFQDWFENIPVKVITDNLRNGIFNSEHRHTIAAMRKMLNFVKTAPSCPQEFVNEIRSWPEVAIRIYSTDVSSEGNFKIAYLIDVMAVALAFLNDDEIFDVLRRGLDLGNVPKSNLKTCRDFVSAFAPFLLKGAILRRDGMKLYVTHAIGCLVTYYTHTKCEDGIYEDILKIVNEHWPIIQNSSVQEICSLLENVKMLDGNRLLELKSAAGRWLLSAVGAADPADAIHLLRVLSCFSINDIDEESDTLLSTALRNYASKLPERLSEITQRSNPRAFSALLDALARTGNLKILDIVIKLAATSDVESGWWDAALEACAIALAARCDPVLPEHIYRSALKSQLAASVLLKKLLLPLLRHSTGEFCEKFYSDVVAELLSCLRRAPRAPLSAQFAYMQLLAEYTTAFILAQLMFEKVSVYALESPSSLLYVKLNVENTWYLVREICKCCDSLRTKITLPNNASDQLKKIYRDFQCNNYNCMAAAFCKRRPEPRLYERLFTANVWPLIVDCDRHYVVDIQTQRRVSSKRLWVCAEEGAGADCAADVRTARTAPARLFARTLSDNPLRYDFLSDCSSTETETSGQAVPVCDNVLNGHECAAALSGLLRQLAGVGAERTSPTPSWLQQLADALIAPDTHINVKSFLAQMICNCTEELKGSRETLTPALLAVAAHAPCARSGKRYLNGLHVNALNTVLTWAKIDIDESHDLVEGKCLQSTLSDVVGLMIDTCIEYRSSRYVLKTLTGLFGDFLMVFGKYVKIYWTKFEVYFKDNDLTIHEVCLQLLITISKNKVYVPELLEAVTSKLENVHRSKVNSTTELFGFAVANCTDEDVKEEYLQKFRGLLKKIQRKNKHEYIKMLFYAQAGCGDCCDSENSRIVVDLAPKMMQTQKEKCYQIIAGYLESADSEQCKELFDTIELDDALAGEHAYVALNVAARGLPRMRDALRRRVVQLAAGCCDSSLLKVRRNAYRVLLKALQGMSQGEGSEPAAKKRKRDFGSEITWTYQQGDSYQTTVLEQLGRGLTDTSNEIRQLVADGLRTALTGHDVRLRFCECFIIVVSLATQGNTGDGAALYGVNRQDAARRLCALIRLLFHELSDDFMRTKLRERPLQVRQSAHRCRLSTQSRTYQGTLRTGRGLGAAGTSRPSPDVASTPVLDVQTPVGNVFNVLLEFAQKNIEAAAALYLQIFRCLLPKDDERSDPFKTQMSSFLHALLKDISGRNRLQELTPIALQMCRLCAGDLSRTDGFSVNLVSELKEYHRNTEGQHMTRLLYEEVLLSAPDDTTFVFSEYIAEDPEPDSGRGQFSLEELTSAFGKLSQWDELTLSQQRCRASTLPMLWADHATFVQALENHTGPDGWLWRMRCAWKRERAGEHFKWVRELDSWPRRPFAAAAVMEAIELYEEKQSTALREWRAPPAPTDCLAEWAARLMARRVVMSTMLEESESENEEYGRAALTQRRHERVWAALANRRGLWAQVLQCVNRNKKDLYDNEKLEWQTIEHAAAYRSEALRISTAHAQRSLVLDKAEESLHKLGSVSPPLARLAAVRQVLDLHHDLLSTNAEKMKSMLESMNTIFEMLSSNERCAGASGDMRLASESAMRCADRLWQCATDSDSRKGAWAVLLRCVENVLKYVPNSGDTALVMLLDKAVHREAGTEAVHMAECILDLVKRNVGEFDDVIWDTLEIMKSKLPDVFRRYRDMFERTTNERSDYYKKCLKLVRCTQNSLMQYCDELRDKLERNDAEGWNTTMEDMHRVLLEAEAGGQQYDLLRGRFTGRMRSLRRFKTTDAFKRTAREMLSGVRADASQHAPRPTLDLDQLCPALARYSRGARANGTRWLEDALRIQKGLHIVKIERQVELINSKQRPALMSLVLSDGRARRFLLKTGDARPDAAAQRLQRRLSCLTRYPIATYQVLALDGDFGVIEFVEGCTTLRALIASEIDLEGIERNVRRPRDTELVATALEARLAAHRALCQKASPVALRRAVERDCSSVQEFVRKQRNYIDSLGAMTVAHWILGLGDRHLENVLFVRDSGRALAVDWESVLERALQLSVPELPPARLTPQLLAFAGDSNLVRCRVECILEAARAANATLAALGRVIFLWHPEYDTQLFQDRLSRMCKKMSGELTSWQSTRAALQAAGPSRHRYIALLDAAHAPSDVADHSVERQAAELLEQCTSVALLSATRAAWEPWL